MIIYILQEEEEAMFKHVDQTKRLKFGNLHGWKVESVEYIYGPS
jgi:hypothetical protein